MRIEFKLVEGTYLVNLSAVDILQNSEPIIRPYPPASQGDKVILYLGDDASIEGRCICLNGSKFTIVNGMGILIAFRHMPSYKFLAHVHDPKPRLRKLNNFLS